jgi:2-dehydro-3-deoxy-L-rhamnonate dehydrogenase (NAD+)
VPVTEFPIDGWNQTFAVNVNGTFFTNKSVLPLMIAQNYGRIVNIASIAGKEGNPNASAYSASKAAVIGFTKSLAKEMAKTNITVNAVTPAAVRTPIFDQMPQAHIDFMLSKIPKGRFGSVDEVAALVCWLASEECSFSTGAVFDISGGRATY